MLASHAVSKALTNSDHWGVYVKKAGNIVLPTNGHALLSPSSSDRWIKCPGSVQAQAAIPEKDTSNEWSRLGTAAHALLEACLITGVPPETFLEHTFLADHPSVDADMTAAVTVAIEYVQEYIDGVGEENVTLMAEQRVHIGPQIDLPEELCNGTSDIMIAHHDFSLLTVIDYKHGSGVKVSAQENSQMMLYSAGARNDLGKSFKRYRVVVVQPRAGKRAPIDEWEFSNAELNAFLRKKVEPSAKAALLPNAPRSAGMHCKFCRAAAVCRTYRERVMIAASMDFADEPPDPNAIGPEEMASILEDAKMIENWLHAVRAHALHLVQQDPRAVPGWKLGWSRRSKEYDDEQGVIEYAKEHGIPLAKFMPRKLLSPAGMAKVFREYKLVPRARRGEAPAPNPVENFVRYTVPTPKLVKDEPDFTEEEDDESEE